MLHEEPNTIFFMLAHRKELDSYIADEREKVRKRTNKSKTARNRGKR